MSTRVKHIIKKLWSLPPKDREVWLEAITGEFYEDFSHAKWREGYEQGKFEGAWVGNQLKDADKIRQELNKPVVPEYIAEWIDACKENLAIGLYTALNPDFMKQYNKSDELIAWVRKHKNQEVFARAWLDGYEVEKEKRYSVVMKATKQPLYYNAVSKKMFFSMGELVTSFTRKELEVSGFGWVFDCEGVEVEEVE
ncbi:DUF1642 domain-containing protein [Streptococcus gordonii]|uniref:DUF1642 domain-containing protein n=1 Tax=Streptococcus gordonii TaxID=1302 RepID=UPI001C8BCBE7|nr:DUF1642 domain-containing protein [Streptococcus gordonii]MBX9096396.1 DUF1642 domain-containing protein [Streptococcus gordonii]